MTRTAASAPQVRIGELRRPRWIGEYLLDEQGVDEHQRGLQQMHREHRDFLAFAIGAGEFGVLAVEDCAVGAIPVLDDLQAFVDFTA